MSVHHLEAEVRRLQQELDDANHQLERVLIRAREITVTWPRPGHVASVSSSPTCACAGLRARRVMDSAADFHANEHEFRCSHGCKRLLDAPL